MKLVLALAIGMVLGTVGCTGGVGPGSPRAALARFAAHLRAGEGASLHAMLPGAHQRAETPARLQARLTANAHEREVLATLVDQALTETGPQAEVMLHGRGTVAMVEDLDGWRMVDPGVGHPLDVSLEGIAGARAAVRALHRNLLRRNYGTWVEALSARARGAVESEAAAIAAMTADPRSLEFSLRNGRASFTLADGRLLDVVFEEGAWRIDGLRDAP